MIVHLIDGTYELYRQHFGQAVRHSTPPPLAATRGVVTSTLQLLAGGATHVAVSVDHVIESFRNDLYDGYKTSEGMEEAILEQLPVMEDALRALGVPVWEMVKYEADDGLAAAARIAGEDARVDQVQMLTPDKDLGQMVSGNRIVQYDRRNDLIINEQAVIEKFGVGPASIADWLALVGDTAMAFLVSQVGVQRARRVFSRCTRTSRTFPKMNRNGPPTASLFAARRNSLQHSATTRNLQSSSKWWPPW